MSEAKQPLGPRQQALVDALRSGDYQQTKGRLKKPDGFCCLGVACDLSGLGTWVDEMAQYGSFGFYPVDKYTSSESWSILTQSVMEYYKFRSSNGRIREGLTLSSMNDAGADFHHIANMIERYSAELFWEPA